MARLIPFRPVPSPLAAAVASLFLVAACAAPGASAAPTAGQSASAAPSALPTPSTVPTSPSLAPTATASPTPTTWSHLTWTRVSKAFTFELIDVVAWQSGYLGVGYVGDNAAESTPAFLESSDGLTWQVTQRLAPDRELTPRWLLAAGDGLVAVFNVVDPASDSARTELWRSSDGRSWQELSSPTWEAAWPTARDLMQLSSGPAGLVAVGRDSDGALALFSADGGRTWQPATLAGDSEAEARGISATAHGFVAVGVVGGRWDSDSRQVLGGSPASWTSLDGRTWQPAEVAPATDAGGLTFSGVYAATDGLLAAATDTSGSVPFRPGQDWASTDGRQWQPLGRPGPVVPCGALAADGVRMLVLGDVCSMDPSDDTPWPGYLAGSTSLDGRTWSPVSFSGQLMDQQSFDGWWLTGQGLIFSATGQLWLAVAN
jgi:hypothetical protein